MSKSHQSPRNALRSAPAFTLVELLVTITIIAALVAISMFGYMKFRTAADRSTSMSNLRQLQIANVTYASDQNGSYVPIRANDDEGTATRWFSDPKYVEYLTSEVFGGPDNNKVNAVPLNMLDPKVVRARNDRYDKIYASFGMNANGLPLGNAPNLKSSYNMNRVTDPARSMAFATATDFRLNYNSRFRWDFENPNDAKTSNGELAYRHGDNILVVYFDGHVGEMSKADLEKIDKQGGRNSAFWRPESN